MHQSKMKWKKLCLYPEVIGLGPTQEEEALQKLEFGSDSAFRSVDLLSEATLHSGEREIYMTHEEEDIDICSNFLIGQCQRHLCPKHHTAWPYVWQLRHKSSEPWFNIDEGAQLVLERLYSDPCTAQVTGFHKGSSMLIDLSTMTVHNSPEFDRIRRLSTSTSRTVKFRTAYKYYYEGTDNTWVEYSPDFMKCIEEGLRERHEEVLCTNSLFTYSLHLVLMVQTNLKTQTKRRMRKRPVFRSPVVLTEKLRALSVSLCHPLERPSSPPDEETDYPKTWVITDQDVIYEKSRVTCADLEYMFIYTYFHRTMAESKYVILEVLRIQNYFQWRKYSQKKKFMRSKLKDQEHGCLERYLFHGTKSNHLEAIYIQNFDPRVSGKNGTAYGRGSYFAKDASYSHGYSPPTPEGHHFMFLAKVLVGRTALGSPSYNRPPPLNDECSNILFDSCVNRAKDPTIFIIFDNDQFYPYFVIKYQKLQDVVLLD